MFTMYLGCDSSQFTCGSGSVRCVDVSKRCDKTPDCLDGSDERDCGEDDLCSRILSLAFILLTKKNENLIHVRVFEIVAIPPEIFCTNTFLSK